MIILFLTLFGAILGSFFNMLIHRLPKEEDIVFKPSHCPKCDARLKTLQLIPILSYLFQFGKCHNCKARISPRYLIVELLTVTLFLVNWHIFGLSYLFFKLTFFCCCLLILFFTDMETYTLPNTITLPLIVIGFSLNIYEHNIIDSLYGIACGFLVYFTIGLVAKLIYKAEAMGGGDMKLGAGIGAFWGLKITALSIYFSFIIGGFFGALLLVLKIKKRKDPIPFGPAIILGFLFTFFYGEALWKLYFG
jgi:leader peptidase (prepilin peptidase)/N-methyltransferase